MDVKTRNRIELKSYFVKNSIPTQSNFEELIEGMLNQKEDGLVKLPGNPLSIEAAGDAASAKEAINFYRNFRDPKPDWSLNLNPRSDPNTPRTAKLGFNISDGDGKSRLFIDRTTGNIGIGTTEPGSTLHVAVGTSQLEPASLRISGTYPSVSFYDNSESAEDRNWAIAASWFKNGDFSIFQSNKQNGDPRNAGTARFYISPDGKVGIGTTAPTHKLEIYGADASLVLLSTATTGIDRNMGIELRTTAPDGVTYIDFTKGSTSTIGSGTPDYGGRISYNEANTGAFAILGGNVGIGTPNPLYKLHVVAPGGFAPEASEGLTQAGNVPIIAQSDSTAFGIINGSGREAFALNIDFNEATKDKRGVPTFYDKYDGAWHPAISLKNGNVGIGTQSPSPGVKLEVAGGLTLLAQEPWQPVTFLNGWRNFWNPYTTGGYFKDSQGVVHLKGMVSGGTIGLESDCFIFTLPAGYRPAQQELHVVLTSDGAAGQAAGRADIDMKGNVIPVSGNKTWISLDGITFRAA
jgi:hypothetical protein